MVACLQSGDGTFFRGSCGSVKRLVMVLPKLFSSRLFGGRTESVHDYVGVLVSLEEAHLHSHSARTGKTEFEEETRDEEAEGLVAGDEEASKDGENGGASGMLQMSAAEYTIEGLKREVRKGERGKVETEYDCKSSYVLFITIARLRDLCDV